MIRVVTAVLVAAGLLVGGYATGAQVKIKRGKSSSVVIRKAQSQKAVKRLQEVVGSVLTIEQSKGRASIWLSVRNEDSGPIDSLKKEQFRVVETINGISHEIPQADVSLDNQLIATILLRDVSTSMSWVDLRLSKKALQAFIGKMSAKDRAELIWFDHRVWIMQPMTADKKLLNSALELPFEQGRTALNDSIVFAINRFNKMGDDGFKHAIVALTDGEDGASTNSLKKVLKFASSASVPIFTIGVGNADASVLSQIAARSQGLYFHTPSTASLASIYDSVSRILRAAFVVAYPTLAKTGDRVEVEVTTSIDEAKKAVFYGTYTAR